MYINKTTKQVKMLFDKIDKLNDNERLKILIYILNGVNNNLVNNKNIANPDLDEDDELTIFTFEDIGMPSHFGLELNKYLLYLYNSNNKNNMGYEDNGHIIDIDYSSKENNILSCYEQLSFFEKLDALAEIIIRYDNETYFEKLHTLTLNYESGYELTKRIIDIKYKLSECP